MATATLTTITPVHIGNGQKLIRDFDFFVEGNKVGFIDLEKVAALLGGDANSIHQLTNAIEKRESIVQFIKKGRGFKDLKPEQICSKIIPFIGEPNSAVTELKEQYYTSLKGPCIPGSSLKGSLRTGILRYLTSEVRNSEERQKQFLRNIDLQAKPDQCFRQLERELFGNDANSKTTRFLTIGDIQFEQVKTKVLELSYENLINSQTKEWSFEEHRAQLVECIPSNQSANFKLNINLSLAHEYKRVRERLVNAGGDVKMQPLRDISVYGEKEIDFLKNINESTLHVLNQDYNILDEMGMNDEYMGKLDNLITKAEQCRDGEALVRVGGHSGWSYMTNRWMVYMSKDVLSDQMYNRIKSKVQRTDRYTNIPLFPKTRKTTPDYELLGFVKISLS